MVQPSHSIGSGEIESAQTLLTSKRASLYSPKTFNNSRSDIETNLLRIAQEALINALKHAHASAIQVELTFGSQAISLCVRDNGQGFNPELQSGKGFGIVGMRERI